MFPEVTTVLGAGAHNHTVCQYTDQDGNATQSFPSATGVATCPVNQTDLVAQAPGWFMPLATGDTGVRDCEQWQLSGTTTSGTINIVLGKPLMFIPLLVGAMPSLVDGVLSAISLAEVKTDACLAFYDTYPGVVTASTITGTVEMVSG